jgi:hypothetical protein
MSVAGRNSWKTSSTSSSEAMRTLLLGTNSIILAAPTGTLYFRLYP